MPDSRAPIESASPLADPTISPANDLNLRIPTAELIRALVQVGFTTKGGKSLLNWLYFTLLYLLT
jgi:hypothetical protein